MTALEATAVLSLGPEGMAVELPQAKRPCPACDGCGYSESPLRHCDTCGRTGLVTDMAPAAPEPLRVSISRARTFRQCPRRGFFEYELNRRPTAQPHEQVWGAALHRGLEEWFTVQHFEGGQDAALGIALNAANASGHDAEGRPYAPPADPYARAALRAMLRAYAAVWGSSDAERYEVVAVELAFDLPVVTATGRESRGRGDRCWKCAGKGRVHVDDGGPVNCPVCLGAGHLGARRVGRVDLVVRERKRWGDIDSMREDVWTVEHKTTGKPPGEEVYYRGIEVDPQIATYHDALTIMGYAPAGVLYDVVRRPDYHEPKAEPKRAPARGRCKACDGKGYVEVECGTCNGEGGCCIDCGGHGVTAGGPKCQDCDGAGRVEKGVLYSNPRFGERAADYEERIYRLATGADETTEEAVLRRRSEWFGRREFRAGEGPLTASRIQEARLQLWSAAREIRAYQRAGVWPEVGDRYVCAPPGRRPVCPWLDVCAGRASADDDRLYPLKIRGMVTEGDE